MTARRATHRRPALAVLGLLVASVASLIGDARPAAAQPATPAARYQLDGEAYAGLPFVLAIVAEGFDEDPAPAQPALTIPGATVTPMGMQPSVQQRIQIDNGRRFESRIVTFVYRYRVSVPRPAQLEIPATTVVQGSKRAAVDGARLEVGDLPSTDDMRITVDMPSRPIWVGETFPLEIDWMLRRDVEDQQFSVPVLAMDDMFAVAAPAAANPRQTLPFSAGATDLNLPYERDEVELAGAKYARFRFIALVTPRKPGHVDVPAAQVFARLSSGGFSRGRLYRAGDVARAFEVAPLPLSGRPAEFAGAVGSSFAISARSSRSVVHVGEPVDLEITVKGDSRLDTLSLGKLDGPGGLPPDKFAVPSDPPTGVLSDDGKTKTFKVSVQVKAPATEIPALVLAYFDPVVGTYQTTRSEPIAMSVKGSQIVGAADVVGSTPQPRPGTAAAAGPAPVASLVGADLALSAPGDVLEQPLGGGILWGLVLALYLVPLAVFAARWWQVRTVADREEAGEVKQARRRVEDELARAATAPGRDVATALPTALRALARAVGANAADDGGLLARIETEGFAPSAASAPLSAPLRSEAAALAKRWQGERKPRAAGAAVVVLLATMLIPGALRAEPLDDARADYQNAMASADPAMRQAAFARAAAAFAAAADAHPGSPRLDADWGNAALGAGDVGAATLAFRRALAIDPGDARARKNLAWLRGRQPEALRPHTGGAADALFFFKEWPRPRRLVVGAAAFALGILLLAPWSRRRRRGLAMLAIAPGVIWLAMTGSVLVEDRHLDDAVIMDGAVLRAADNLGAPAALSAPLSPGIEVTVLERRDGWSRIALASGTAGWLPDGALALVAAPRR